MTDSSPTPPLSPVPEDGPERVWTCTVRDDYERCSAEHPHPSCVEVNRKFDALRAAVVIPVRSAATPSPAPDSTGGERLLPDDLPKWLAGWCDHEDGETTGATCCVWRAAAARVASLTDYVAGRAAGPDRLRERIEGWEALAENLMRGNPSHTDRVAAAVYSSCATNLRAALASGDEKPATEGADACQRCDGSGREPSPTGMAQIGAPSCLACNGTGRA